MNTTTIKAGAVEPGARGPAAGRPETRAQWLCLPREHGSWGMLLFPFVSGAVLAGSVNVWLLPALLAALAVFLIREPIVVLWRGRPDRTAAWRTLFLTGGTLAVSGLWLLAVLPLFWLSVLGGAAVVLTLVYVRAVVHGRQRAIPLQIVGAAGLTSSVALAYLAGGRQPDFTLLLLWVSQTVYYTGSVLKIHALIEARKQRAGTVADDKRKRGAMIWLAVQITCALAFCVGGYWLMGAALSVPALVHGFDLRHMNDPSRRKTRLRTIGFRELGLSTVFSVLAVLSLW